MQALGFMGITERYDASLALLNALYGVNIVSVPRNVHDSKSLVDFDALARNATLAGLLADDATLCEIAVVFHQQRVRMAAKCKPFAHGHIDAVEGGVVRGWTWWSRTDEPVMVSVMIDGAYIGQVRALNPDPLAEWNAPRGGRVGFALLLPAELAVNSTVRCTVASTWQVLGEFVV